MSAAGVIGSTEPKIASVGHIVGRHVERLDRVPRPLPVLGRAHHAVERDRGVEAVAGGGLEHVVPAHAEAEHAHPRHVVLDHEEVGRALEHVELLGVVEILHGGEPLLDRCQVLLRDAGERLDRAHGEPVRREAARHVVEERPQPADVGMEHDARRGMPSGRACTAGTSTVSSVSVTGSTDTSSSRPSRRWPMDAGVYRPIDQE